MAENMEKWGRAKAKTMAKSGPSGVMPASEGSWASYAKGVSGKSTVGGDGVKAVPLPKKGLSAGADSGVGRLQKSKRANP